MKKLLKSSLSIFLAITIIFSSAYVGLSEVDFSNLFAVEAEATSESDLTFTLNTDGESYYVSSCKESAEDEIVIPSTYKNKPVTSIGAYAFSGCTGLTSIIISDGVTSIGQEAFASCTSLKSITIPDSVTNIKWRAFRYCSNLKDVYITSLASWCEMDIHEDLDFSVGYSNPLYYADNLYIDGKLTTDIVIPDNITKINDFTFCNFTGLTSVIISDSVTSIGNYAFKNCINLSSIELPDNLIHIGELAFDGTTYLNNESISDNGVYYLDNFIVSADTSLSGEYVVRDSTTLIVDSAFRNCTNLTSITFPDSVLNIGESAFRNCTNLTAVSMPDSITSIGYGTFYNCTSLTSIEIPDSVTSIGGSAFNGCTNLTSITIPDSVTSIGGSAFGDCDSLTSIIIPDSVTSISGSVFYNCDSLTSIIIPDSVTSIGGSAFGDCDRLTSITIPDNVTSIGGSAFKSCDRLVSITIPGNVTSIGEDAFYNCGWLESVYITDMAAWCNIDFGYGDSNPLTYAYNLYINGYLSNDIVIPDGVTKISDRAFGCFKGLTSITIPDSVTSIGGSAFYSCHNLSSIVIPDSVTSIGDSAFFCCYNLASIVIPDSVISIDSNAFWNCSALKYVFYKGQRNQWDNILSQNNQTGLENLPIHFGTTEHVPSNEWVNDADFDCINNDVNFKHNYCVVCGYLLESKEVFTDGHLFADDICEYCDAYVYSYSVVNNEVTITNYMGDEEDIILPSVIEGFPVTNIGESAFKNNTNIKSVVIPEGIIRIGNYVFEGCYNLEAVVIPNSVISIGDYAFSSCQNLINISIPEGVTTIGLNSFFGCGSLISIVIPDSVISLGEAAFDSCLSLEAVTIGDGLSEIPLSAFSDCRSLISVTMGTGISKIKNYAFQNCDKLSYLFYEGTAEEWETVVIGTGNKYLKNSVIHYSATDHVASEEWENSMDFDCGSGEPGTLYKVCKYCECVVETKDVPPGHMYENAICVFCGHCYFYYEIVNGEAVITGYNGTNSEVTIPSSIGSYYVTQINDNAFSGCLDITTIVIPETVTYIGNNAFNGCEKLKEINVDEENKFYVSENGILFDKNRNVLIKVPCAVTGRYVIPDGIINIENNAFSMCDELTSLVIPNSVNRIGDGAFGICTRLTDVYYNDFKTQWENITIGTHNDNLLNATIHYKTDGHFYGDWIIDKEPTCNESGSRHKICSVCGDVVTEAISATGHIYSIEWTIDVAPSCTSDGSKSHHCINCEAKASVTTIPATGHSYSAEWTIDKEPTCTKDGQKSHHCLVLGCKSMKDITVIDKTGHDLVTEITSEPTCTEGGKELAYCTKCDYEVENEIPSAGHTATDWEIDKNPSCAEEGSQFKYCTVCGVTLETEAIAKKAHQESQWIIDREATVYKAGSKHKECTECGEILKTAEIPQLKCAKPVLKKVYNANDYVKVTWGTVKGADIYRVYRMVSGGEYEYIGSTKNTYFNDKEAGAGKTCRYRIRAKNEAGYSEYSVSMAIKHIDEPNLIATENTSSGVKITWGNKVTGAQKYNVYRRVSGGEYKYIGSTSDTYYIDETVKSGTKYHYAIRGKRDDSVSSQSESLSKYYLDAPTLNKPSSTTKGIGIKWSQVEGAEGYVVYRRTTDDNYIIVANEKGGSNTDFRDTTTKKGRIYYYRVKAYKSKTYSGNSVTKSVRDEH